MNGGDDYRRGILAAKIGAWKLSKLVILLRKNH